MKIYKSLLLLLIVLTVFAFEMKKAYADSINIRDLGEEILVGEIRSCEINAKERVMMMTLEPNVSPCPSQKSDIRSIASVGISEQHTEAIELCESAGFDVKYLIDTQNKTSNNSCDVSVGFACAYTSEEERAAADDLSCDEQK